MDKTEYAAYLESQEWAHKRREALTRANFKCERCRNEKDLRVHHISYDRLGTTDEMVDLVVLCKTCHYKEHGSQLRKNGKITKLEKKIIRWKNKHNL
jgi:5-methylcytosine-specific restriction endonuclease McrA